MSIADSPLSTFLDELAAGTPTPGGGSVAALVGALAAGLESMVAHYTVGREEFASVQPQVEEVLRSAESLRGELTSLVDADVAAYAQVAAAYRLPRETAPEKKARTAAIQEALKAACQVPVRTALACHHVLRLTRTLVDKGNPRLVSDVGVAAALAEAAFQCAWLNVEVNLGAIRDQAYVEQVRRIIEPLLGKQQYLREDVWGQVVKMVR